MAKSSTRFVMRAAQSLVAAGLLGRIVGLGDGVLPPAPFMLALLGFLWLADAVIGRFSVAGRNAAIGDAAAWLRAHRFATTLIAITTISLVIRMVGLADDLGHVPLGIDENRLNTSVLHFFGTGEIDHRTVEHYPGIHFWLLAGSYLLAYLRGLLGDVASTLPAMPPEMFVAAGRLVSVVQGTATVALTGLIGRSIGGSGAGLLAATLLGMSPIAVALSRQLRNDAAQTLLVVAAVAVALRIVERRGGGLEATAAGGLVGLATAVKYTGVFALLPVAVAIGAGGAPGRRLRDSGLAVAAFAVAAAVSNHFVWADFPNFLTQLSDQVGIMGVEHWAAQENPGFYHASILQSRVVGWPLLLLGGALAAYRLGAGEVRWWVLLSFPMAYIWVASGQPSQLPRWAYPSAPFVAVAASAALVTLLGLVARRAASLNVPVAAVRHGLIPACGLLALGTILLDASSLIARRFPAPTYRRAENWIVENSAPGDRILIERGWLALDGHGFAINRVRDLGDLLDGGLYQLAANDWIVVHEEHLGNPSIERLRLVEAFPVDASRLGNYGPDLAIYAPPRIRTSAALDVSFDGAEAARYLGNGWSRGGSGRAGLALPAGGASIFLPPFGARQARLEIDVLGSASVPPPGLRVVAGGADLQTTIAADAAGDRVVYGAELSLLQVGPEVFEVRLVPAAAAQIPGGGAAVRVLGFRLASRQ